MNPGQLFALEKLFAGWRSADWSRRIPPALAGLLGMSVPIALAELAGQAPLGVAAALGGMAISSDGGDDPGATFRERAPRLLYDLMAGCAAMVAGAALSGRGLYYFCLPVIAGCASLAGGLTRPLARASTMFVLYAVIAAHIGAGGAHPAGLMLLFFLGAVWTGGLRLGFGTLFPVPHRPDSAPVPRYTAAQYFHRWKRSLARLAGWQYAFRLTACLAAAQAYEWLWPHHHGYWASLTVVIVVQRNLQSALARTLHRAAGTSIGVLFVGLLLLGAPPTWFPIFLIGVLAGARPVLREASYTAYAAVMTPLVVLLLEFGQAPSWAVIVDRLAATLVGCALALTLGYLGWSRLAAAEGKR